jgi:hypothetical protein
VSDAGLLEITVFARDAPSVGECERQERFVPWGGITAVEQVGEYAIFRLHWGDPLGPVPRRAFPNEAAFLSFVGQVELRRRAAASATPPSPIGGQAPEPQSRVRSLWQVHTHLCCTVVGWVAGLLLSVYYFVGSHRDGPLNDLMTSSLGPVLVFVVFPFVWGTLIGAVLYLFIALVIWACRQLAPWVYSDLRRLRRSAEELTGEVSRPPASDGQEVRRAEVRESVTASGPREATTAADANTVTAPPAEGTANQHGVEGPAQ